MFQIGFFILIFLLGSIPFGLLISRYWLKVDIRRQGSGNIGMTNVMRVGGKWPGIVTFVLDFGKGSLAVLTAQILFPVSETEPESQLIFHSLAGTTVVCGHVFSVFLRFKGGKGISTLFGVLAILQLNVGICAAWHGPACICGNESPVSPQSLCWLSFRGYFYLFPGYRMKDQFGLCFSFFFCYHHS